MDLIECSKCKGMIKERAYTCPHCGAKRWSIRHTFDWVMSIVILVFVITTIILLGKCAKVLSGT